MNDYTVRVTMVIEAEMNVSASTREEAEKLAIQDYDEVWSTASVDSTTTEVIEENGKDV
jgi:hypothetical protein